MDAKPKTNKRKKIRVEILGDSMLNGVQEKRLNKNADINIKMRKYPGHHRPAYWTISDQV